MSFNFEEIEKENHKKFKQNIKSDTEFIHVSPLELHPDFPLKRKEIQPCVLPKQYMKFAEEIKNFNVRSDDVWIISFPRSGTTLTQELVWILTHNFNFEKAKEIDLILRSPFLEMNTIADKTPDILQHLKNMPSPRCIKTHLPIQLLPDQIWKKKPKILYVQRDSKDVAVSYFHHAEIYLNFSGSIEDFIGAFMSDCVFYTPYFSQINNYLKISEAIDNVLILNYEEMKNDIENTIKLISNFLDITINEENLRRLSQHLSFENMKNNKSVNREESVNNLLSRTNRNRKLNKNLSFIRNGRIEGWKDEMSPELSSKMDKWIQSYHN